MAKRPRYSVGPRGEAALKKRVFATVIYGATTSMSGTSNFVSGASLGTNTVNSTNLVKTGTGAFNISTGVVSNSTAGSIIFGGTLTLNQGTTTGNAAGLLSGGSFNIVPGRTTSTAGSGTTTSGATLTLNPGNPFTGATTIGSGSLTLNQGAGGSLNVNRPPVTAGTLTLNGTNPVSQTGATGTFQIVNGGTLTVVPGTIANGGGSNTSLAGTSTPSFLTVTNGITAPAGALLFNPLDTSASALATTSLSGNTASAGLTTTAVRLARVAGVSSSPEPAANLSGAAPVPEPSSAALAFFGALVFARRRAFRA